jgi:hypothetical protein
MPEKTVKAAEKEEQEDEAYDPYSGAKIYMYHTHSSTSSNTMAERGSERQKNLARKIDTLPAMISSTFCHGFSPRRMSLAHGILINSKVFQIKIYWLASDTRFRPTIQQLISRESVMPNAQLYFLIY